MNSFTNTLLTLLLGWLRTLLNAARDFISSDSSTVFFDFFRSNWKVIFVILCLGGFALDKIVYLIRWRPSPIWIRMRARRKKHRSRPQPGYNPNPPEYAFDPPAFDEDTAVVATEEYQPAFNQPVADAAPTMQYQMQPHAAQPQDDSPSYTTPYFAPEAASYPEEAPLYRDEPAPEMPYEPVTDQQRFAFGMAPSFGSAQSEPAYSYYRDATPSFAPPQYAQEYNPEPTYAPPSASRQTPYEPEAYAPEAYEPEPVQPPDYQEPSPYFRPFSDRGEETFAPPRNRRFGSVARKARNLLNADESKSVSYQDLQPTVDVSKAFHSPVYPRKKPEGD